LKRGDFSSIKKVYREASDWLHKGITVLFFPEGTRSDNVEMGEFQNGAFKLAIKEKVPVLPIRIQGTRDAIPKGSWRFTTKVSCLIKVLPPIDTSVFAPGDYNQLRDLARRQLCSN
jgi:1-acyl-sn-glycerol-3-phosphate acyltransferase